MLEKDASVTSRVCVQMYVADLQLQRCCFTSGAFYMTKKEVLEREHCRLGGYGYFHLFELNAKYLLPCIDAAPAKLMTAHVTPNHDGTAKVSN